VVVPKRTALLLDRLMVALQKAVDGNNSGNMKGYYPERSIPISGAPRPSPGVSNFTNLILLFIHNIISYRILIIPNIFVKLQLFYIYIHEN